MDKPRRTRRRKDAAPVRLTLTDWRTDLVRARAIVDPTLRARAAMALAEAALAAVEEIAERCNYVPA